MAAKLKTGDKLPHGATVMESNDLFILAKTYSGEYVTWRWNGTDLNSTCGGHYYQQNLGAAVTSFETRTAEAGVRS